MGNVNSIPIEIWFDICEFVKLNEAPNLFLVNFNSLTICEEFFFSGNVEKKRRNIRALSMTQPEEGNMVIKILQDDKIVPVPEIDPPNVFKSFGHIKIENNCYKPAIEFLLKYQELVKSRDHIIKCNRQFFVDIDMIKERELFLNWLEQKDLLELQITANNTFPQIARMLTEPVIAKFNGFLSMQIKDDRNLCEPEGQQEDAKLIYEWLSAGNGKIRQFDVFHYDGKKATELAYKIIKHFEMAHSDKKIVEKMDMLICVPFGIQTEITKYEKKIFNSHGDHLATLRSYSSSEFEFEKGMIPAYLFFTKPLENLFPIDKKWKMINLKYIHFK